MLGKFFEATNFNYIIARRAPNEKSLLGGCKILSLLIKRYENVFQGFHLSFLSQAQKQSQWNTEVLIIFRPPNCECCEDFVSSHLALAPWKISLGTRFFFSSQHGIPRQHNNSTVVCFSDEKNIKHWKRRVFMLNVSRNSLQSHAFAT